MNLLHRALLYDIRSLKEQRLTMLIYVLISLHLYLFLNPESDYSTRSLQYLSVALLLLLLLIRSRRSQRERLHEQYQLYITGYRKVAIVCQHYLEQYLLCLLIWVVSGTLMFLLLPPASGTMTERFLKLLLPLLLQGMLLQGLFLLPVTLAANSGFLCSAPDHYLLQDSARDMTAPNAFISGQKGR